MPFGLLRAGGGLLSGPVMWIIGAAVVALVITGLQMIRNSGYAAAEASNLRGVAMAEREARERSATDVEWLQHRQGQARDTESELRREVDLWRERARTREAEQLEQPATGEPVSKYCRPGCLLEGE